uniref:Aminotransferase class I/classII large domain-containing protein n=1 Tax=Glycine max TaxID=3847 RepID=K7KCQ3_SOYBN
MLRCINGRIARRFLSTSSPKDPIVSVNEAFLADPFPHKINLGIGTYRGDDGKPFVPQSVRDAETKIQRCKLEHFYPDSQMYLPDPTWSNHHNIWRQAEIPVKTFHYYHPDTKGLDFAALLNDVKNRQYALSFIGCFLSCLSDKSNTLYYHECTRLFFLLHPCAHNPTGVDPSEEKWREISLQFKAKNHFPFFDMAYQGFSSGDLDKDVIALRIFLEDGHLIGCAQSFAKNMGLSEHKAGCLSVLCQSIKRVAALKSQLQLMSHAMYSSIPFQGISLVKQLEKLFHIYMTPDGRMSMSGVTSSNVDYLANAIHQVTRIDEEALRSC